MSLTKKDPSLRVAANDPHLVSLGGGRLSTAVTIHYIPIGDTTIGCSTTCSISLNGTGVRSTHCTIYRSEENEVTIVPEHDARILIDGSKVTQETNLTQGAMITIGNSNYLRFNNPAEAQMMRSAMGSNERISMPQIDFTQVPAQQHNSVRSVGGGTASNDALLRQSIDRFYETKINPNLENPGGVGGLGEKVHYNNVVTPIDINGLHCPKVFTADLVTVNMPAKDVLGQKYANFARNLAENHRNIDKNSNNALRNNQMSNLKTSSFSVYSSSASIASSMASAPASTNNSYVNIPNPNNYIQNAAGSSEYLSKVNNVNNSLRATNTNAYDRYPKPGAYGGLQIYPMNGVNTEINNASPNASPHHPKTNNQPQQTPHLSSSEHERLEDMLKICTEYADRQLQQQNQNQSQNQSQNNSITSSPIVQNRIKTNGSLPRDKKSPFHHQHDLSVSGVQQPNQTLSNSSSSLASTQAKPFANGSSSSPSSTGYENVRLVGQNRVEINGQVAGGSPKTGYENITKYVPQSPRTKIRTTCMSPKKHSEHAAIFNNSFSPSQAQPQKSAAAKQKEYEQLIKTFEEKLELEMQAIEESSRYQAADAAASLQNSPSRRANKNINNLTLNLHASNSLQNSPRLSKKPAPAPRNLSNPFAGEGSSSNSNLQRLPPLPTAAEALERSDVEKLLLKRKEYLSRIERLKRDISDLQKQENEALRELDLEKALVSAELNSVGDTMESLEQQLQLLQNKIHRMEAQRNAARVMEENQQAKLKQSMEMKQDQVKKLKAMLKQKANNDCLKEELHNVADSLENDRKTFEDLEFQYLEEESEWQAYREDLHAEETALSGKIAAQRLELQHLEKQEKTNQTNASSDAITLKQTLLTLLSELKQCQEHLRTLETGISDVTGQLNVNSSEEEDFEDASASTASPQMQLNLAAAAGGGAGVMSQSLFGSTELLCPKRNVDGLMSKSVNENMFYNNKIEVPSSTPKRPPLQVVDICSDAETRVVDGAAEADGGESIVNAVDEEMPQNERVKFNLSLGSDDFEVNPLEKRVPSQDDIDRISKVTLDAPISTKGATTKIFDSIKEIERNRQLLLAQQGHHVIEHERQKMQDLKKKSHDEARAQYLSMLNCSLDGGSSSSTPSATKSSAQQQQSLPLREQIQTEAEESRLIRGENGENSMTEGPENNTEETPKEHDANDYEKEQSTTLANENNAESTKHRHSQPELDHHHHHQQQQQYQRNSRPLSESNSEFSSADLLSVNNQSCKSNLELSNNTTASSRRGSASRSRNSVEHNASSDGAAAASAIKRSSVNSHETASLSSERKRAPLPKHQRPLTRYLPIFSPDLNLRHHIESAGHQIALCPHVFVDAYSCRGYLHKLGATFHGWARRWFVLDRQRNALIYFSDKSERKPRGGAYFSTIDEVYLDHLNASKSGRPHCTFIVKTKKRSYQLQAASDATARIWIDAIITGAQGNLDY